MGIFCRKHSDSEESISVIANILSNNDSIQFDKISNEFKSLGFNKVKDLAQATLGKASQMSLGGDPLAKLYGAIQMYDELCANRFKSAQLLYERGYYVKAQEMCQKLYPLQPNDVNLLLLLSASYFMTEEYEKSIEILNKVPQKYRRCVEVLNNLGTNYLRKGQTIEARDYFYEAICQKPDYIDCWINYIKILLKINDHTNAMLALKMVINYEPDLLTARHLYGKLLLTLNRVEEALQQFKLAIRSKPDSAPSWIHLGNVYLDTNKMNEAVICYEKALEINSYLITPRINLGIAYFKLKEYKKSINALKCALQLCPINMDILKIMARVYFSQKDIQSAIKTYTLCLKLEPNNPDIYYDLGVLYFSSLKNAAAAEPYFKKCIELNSNNEEYYRCLAMVYQDQRNYEHAYKMTVMLGDLYLNRNDIKNATSAYYYATHIFPQNYYAHWKLGHIFYKLEHCDKSLTRYEKSKELKPNFAFTFSDIALIREEQNQLEAAEKFYEQALQLQPKNYNTVHNLIVLKQKIGRIDDIIGLYNLLLKRNISDSCDMYREMANFFYRVMGNFRDAHSHLVKALEIRDFDLNTYIHLGNLSLELKNNNEALTYFRKAIEINSQCITARINIGCIYKDEEQFNEAIKEFVKVLSFYPNHPDAYSNLLQCEQYTCKFKHLSKKRLNKLTDIVLKQLTDNKVPCLSPEQSLLYELKPEVLKQIASKHAEQLVKKPYIERNLSRGYVHEKSLSFNGCLRVGYIYSHCNNHPTSELVNSIQNLHDQNKVEVFCYSLSAINNSSGTNSSILNSIVDISNLSSIDAANKINADRIHILVNVNGSSNDIQNELLALRPAPIQVKLLGHPGTSGATFVDYFITDNECSPPELQHFYTEKLSFMNRTVFFGDHKLLFNDLSQRNPQNRIACMNNSNEAMCVDENNFNENVSNNITSMYSVQILPDDSIKCYTRQMYNLPEDCIVYCYFGQLYKINTTTLNMWITILKGVTNCVLWLLRFPNDAENNIHEFVATNGIDPARVIFSNVAPKDEHMRRIQLADIFLDTPLYNGHKSCLDALWAGIPIVTLSGKTFASRMATSQLTALNCTEMIAQNEYEYTKIAINLGMHKPLLDQMRLKIWQSKTTSELFDCKSYAENLEIVYLNMWNQLS